MKKDRIPLAIKDFLDNNGRGKFKIWREMPWYQDHNSLFFNENKNTKNFHAPKCAPRMVFIDPFGPDVLSTYRHRSSQKRCPFVDRRVNKIRQPRASSYPKFLLNHMLLKQKWQPMHIKTNKKP
jgi:hypothetical protein